MARPALRGATVVLAAVVAALALLAVGGAFTPAGLVAAPNLWVQFGVSSGAAVAIVNALTSWWAVALTLALVPLGLGFAAVTIRLTWQSLVAALGQELARKAMIRF